MENTVMKETRSIMYFLFAMIAFGFLGLEFGVLFISRLVDGRSLAQVGQWPIHWYGAIAHWMMTIVVWLSGVLLIWLWVKKRGLMDSLIDFKVTRKTLYYTLVAILVVILSAVIQSLINDTTIPQVFSEYQGFVRMYGENALIVTIFQVLYYFVEMLLVFIMIVLFQRMGNNCLKTNIFHMVVLA